MLFLAKYPHFHILFLLRYFHEQPSEREVFFAVLKHCPLYNCPEINDWVDDLKCHTFLGHLLLCLSGLTGVLETSTVRPSVRNLSSHTS